MTDFDYDAALASIPPEARVAVSARELRELEDTWQTGLVAAFRTPGGSLVGQREDGRYYSAWGYEDYSSFDFEEVESWLNRKLDEDYDVAAEAYRRHAEFGEM